MALKIIGSGLGRTGTASLKAALEQLGFRCHHMIEVFMHMETIPLWAAAFQGRPDWPAIYKDYTATVDYPGAAFWRELAQEYPDAKVLHTLRDPDEWFESTQATIFAPRGPTENPPEPIRPMFDAMMASSRMPQNRHDRASMVAYFKKHNDEVVREIPAKRLLFYNVAEGFPALGDVVEEQPRAGNPSANSSACRRRRRRGIRRG